MDGSTVAIILLVGGFLTIACATVFVWATMPRFEDWPDEGELGGEAFITVRPGRFQLAPPDTDSELGLAAGNGGEPSFIRNEGEAGKAAPAVLGPRSRFRLVS